ncbi:ChbG/HpnK family deacetylase [Segnochrobactrum spirostomi]|uniref:ChbG/HpnK family deacetylase n=1 Tax=Segnochrobactrum spirostomi TaxID=2608987 RepID=A0A6A7YB87_9HYPH|nr:ChbG/HpnK family deacetylase [Segnochrobactrum spirostomi]MQT15221.1 ChbG/HpnK family deacetylase [Segnochrobactrum spirostomi]
MTSPAPPKADTRIIVNIDDLGMCHGANAAFLDLWRLGRCDSGSVMVPCPWFLEIAEAGRADPSLQLGVHLTITAEKRHYRWRPLTAPSRAAGLVDDDGYLWGSVAAVRRSAAPEAVEAEMRAQIEAFLAAGLKPTHVDAHQAAALAPEFASIYLALAVEYRLPAMVPRALEAYGPVHNLGAVDPAFYARTAAGFAATGGVPVDRVLETPWHREAPAATRYAAFFSAIGPGVTFLALHANAPGEIEAIEPATAAIRTEEYDFLRGIESAAWFEAVAPYRTTLAHLAGDAAPP